MSTPVADRSSNKNEQIVHAAEVIGKSKYRRRIFTEIYTGKTKIKTVPELMKKTKMIRTRVLDAGKALAVAEIVNQLKVDGVTAYEKIDFLQPLRDKILRAKDAKARAAIPTKRNPSGQRAAIKLTPTVKIPVKRNRAVSLTIDDIESFRQVRGVPHGLNYVQLPEATFKNGVAAILGERGPFTDWGGELRDLSSTHLRIGGKRRAAAIAFKGPGKKGTLTPGKMGKHGDQIQRLLKCPADIYLVQYWAHIDDSIYDQLEQLVQLKSYFQDRPLWYGVIDGDDSARLIQAYPQQFKKSGGRKKR